MERTTLEHPPRFELDPSGWKPDVLPLTLRMRIKKGDSKLPPLVLIVLAVTVSSY